MTKICIWCRRKEPEVRFTTLAHIFPQSIGGKRTCSQVCDGCNIYFGSKQPGLPSVEIALKEPLNISRLYLFTQVCRNKKLPRFKSEYFEYNLATHIIKTKNKYSLMSDFQRSFTKQFKRGIYKIFLEERSESIGDVLDSRFDFIREFARYGLGDYPVFYFRPKAPTIFMSMPDVNNPVIRFTDYSELEIKEYGFYSYYFITHMIAIPVIRSYELTIDNYANFLLNNENSMFSKLIPLKYITDLDFIFSFAN